VGGSSHPSINPSPAGTEDVASMDSVMGMPSVAFDICELVNYAKSALFNDGDIELGGSSMSMQILTLLCVFTSSIAPLAP
jgi:hypothetical protein